MKTEMKKAYAQMRFRGIGAIVYRYLTQQLGQLEAGNFVDQYHYPHPLANNAMLNRDCVRFIHLLGAPRTAQALAAHYLLNDIPRDMEDFDEETERLLDMGGREIRPQNTQDDTDERRGIASIVYQFLLQELGINHAHGFAVSFGLPRLDVNQQILVTHAIRWLWLLGAYVSAVNLAGQHLLLQETVDSELHRIAKGLMAAQDN